MFTKNLAAFGVCVFMAVPAAFAAGTGNPLDSMSVGARTSQPIGHYEFCQDRPEECRPNGSAAPVQLTPARWNELTTVNKRVNERIRPVPDLEIWGKAEVWSYPDIMGDCEDYVLLKRRLLMHYGWPEGTLLITVVRQTNGDGHAVLTVRTDGGDYVLDNLEPSVVLWTRTPYQFVKRQSETNAGQWVSISDDRPMLVGSVRP
jgi:predicted transglutaminase-like cysteine proteinase